MQSERSTGFSIGRLLTKPAYLILLLLFFVLKGYNDNYPLVPAGACLALFLQLLVACTAGLLLSFFFFRHTGKAVLFTFILFAINFFFGSFHDALKSVAPGTFLSKYSFVLGLVTVLLIVAVAVVRKNTGKGPFVKYLNLLFLLFLLIESARLVSRVSSTEETDVQKLGQGLQRHLLRESPDVYIIVADEYAGAKTLLDRFGFDNSAFTGYLEQRGFAVVKSSYSNYNYTPISIASTFNFDYLNLGTDRLSAVDMKGVYKSIDTNILIRFLRVQGYRFYNNSIFTVNGVSPLAKESFLPMEQEIILSQTLVKRIYRDLWYHLYEKKILKGLDKNAFSYLRNNERIIAQTMENAAADTSGPKVVYTHLNLPHYPYYYDSSGTPITKADYSEQGAYNEGNYLGYLKYSNTVWRSLIDFILSHSRKPPLILFFSDHGFRYYKKETDRKYQFYNMASVYFRGDTTFKLPDSTSNVNFVRRVFNKAFEQNLPMRKDTFYYIRRFD